MVREVRVVIRDDLDSSEGADTIPFAFDGVGYEIDLTNDNYTKFANLMSPFINAARPVGKEGSAMTAGAKKKRTAELKEVRRWANDKGYDVPSRGQVPTEVIEAFNDANGPPGRLAAAMSDMYGVRGEFQVTADAAVRRRIRGRPVEAPVSAVRPDPDRLRCGTVIGGRRPAASGDPHSHRYSGA
jgi:hypothetical protein